MYCESCGVGACASHRRNSPSRTASMTTALPATQAACRPRIRLCRFFGVESVNCEAASKTGTPRSERRAERQVHVQAPIPMRAGGGDLAGGALIDELLRL